MKPFDTELKKYAEKVALKASERRELRERILSYMEYHPLPKQALEREELAYGIPSESFRVFHFTMHHARVLGGIFAVVLILAPFVAERSMPGDVLYLVKTGFNEPFQKQLANSPYEKIEFETKLMERRIAEARVLAEEGKLTEEVKNQIASDVKAHTTAVRSGLEELRTQDADGAAIAEIAFNSKLDVQAAVLDSDESGDSAQLLAVVDEARVETATKQGENKASFDGLMARIELETTRAYELFGSVKKTATYVEERDIERRLSDINRLVAESKRRQSVNAERATADLATTLGLTQKLVVFLTDINVRQTVALEKLVPVVLSDEERTAIARAELETIGTTIARVMEELQTLEDAGVREKIELGLADASTLTGDAAFALEQGDIEGAEKLVADARALSGDLSNLAMGKGGNAVAKENPDEAVGIMMMAAPGEGEGAATSTPPEGEGSGPVESEAPEASGQQVQ